MNETIKQDYFKLIRDLNKSNKTKNESTELYFFIEKSRFYAALSKNQKIFLCLYEAYWRPAEQSNYPELQKHISNFLNKNKNASDLTREILSNIFQKLD